MNKNQDNNRFILSIDQGTSGTKVLIIDQKGQPIAKSTAPLSSLYLEGGWVEQVPGDLLANVLDALKTCLSDFEQAGYSRAHIRTCGISNQRETFLVWDRQGKPLCNAIVWQCKRSIPICKRLKEQGLEGRIKETTGLIIDPYFSGTKLIWLREQDPTVRKAMQAGTAYFGTVDTWLLYALTAGEAYLTDYTNASRTLFFDLRRLDWDWDLVGQLGLTGIQLPEVRPSAADFGQSDFNGLFDRPIPISAMIGDSHAAAFGEGCFTPGTAKATLGTGCSVLMHAGNRPIPSAHGMVTTICWSTAEEVAYGLEGVIVSCGASLEWLKQQLNLFSDSTETEAMASALESNQGVYLIPAFSGLGAPHWDMSRKASLVGLTFDCHKGHVVRAALESIPYQIKDVITAMEQDSGLDLERLMVDGGISNNAFVTQFLADLLQKQVSRMANADVSALGAAYLAGLQAGIFPNLEVLQGFQERTNILPVNNAAVAASYRAWQELIAQKHGV